MNRVGYRLATIEELFAAEESHARPVHELRQVLLRIHQRIVVLLEVSLKQGSASQPIFYCLMRQPFWQQRVVHRREMNFLEAILWIRADVVKEIVGILAG